MAIWKTSVDSLVRNFMEALNASVAPMRTARILDDDLIGYDDWGRLCDMLYNLLVIDPIRSTLPEEQRIKFDLPAYETEYEHYEDFSLIQVTPPGQAVLPDSIEQACLFYRFLPLDDNNDRFGLVETFRLDSEHHFDEMSFGDAKLDDIYFTCLLTDGKSWRLVDEVEVMME